MSVLRKIFGASRHFTIIKPNFDFSSEVNSDFDTYSGIIATQLTCQKVLAEQLSKLPLEVYKSSEKEGKLKYKDHYLYRLLHNKPNEYQTQTLFFQTLEKHRNHYGNAFAKINRGGDGAARSLEIIHPAEIKAYKIKNGKLFFYRVDENGKETTINNDNILHFRFLSEDGIFGINPIEALYSELNNIWHGKTTLNNSYRNNLNIDKVIESTISNYNSTTAKTSIEELRKEYSGSFNSKKTPVLPAGFKVTPIQSSSIQDAEILQSLEMSKRDIAALYGVPLNLIGLDGGSYASIEQNSLNFKVNTLQPIARMYRQELESKLLMYNELDEGISIEFNLSAIVETDMTTRINYLKTLSGMGVISANDVARMEGFNTYENGDLHFIQSQNIPIEDYEKYAKIMQSANQNNTIENDTQE